MIYLEPKEIEYLGELLSSQKQWWLRDKLLEKLLDEDERFAKISKCNHTYKKYSITREETKCSECGHYGEEMGFSETTKLDG